MDEICGVEACQGRDDGMRRQVCTLAVRIRPHDAISSRIGSTADAVSGCPMPRRSSFLRQAHDFVRCLIGLSSNSPLHLIHSAVVTSHLAKFHLTKHVSMDDMITNTIENP